MISNWPCLRLWRLVVEAASPLSIGTGRGDGVNDVVLAQDANGLPMLPASAVAGVLRSAWRAVHGNEATNALFGFADGRDGQVSRLVVGHGHIHDSQGNPVLGLDQRAGSDPLLAPLLSRRPTVRQRVRLGHRGTADARGFFDRSVLPAGHRFGIELLLWSDSATASAADGAGIEALLTSGQLRIGGATRSGLGQLRITDSRSADFDLRVVDDLKRFAALDRSIGNMHGLKCVAPAPAANATAHLALLVVKLSPEAGFRFGGGTRSLQLPRPEKLPDDLPATESKVTWTTDAGGRTIGELTAWEVLVPATGVKGPLAHRTAYHANCRIGMTTANWREKTGAGAGASYDKSLHSDSVRRLFGWATDHTVAGGAASSQAGVLSWSDVVLDAKSVCARTQWHNSIDRFTGGVRRGALFTGENLHAAGTPGTTLFELRLTLDLPRARACGVTAELIGDLEKALDDLVQGRLALGADGARGLGHFNGSWAWQGGRPDLTATAEAGSDEQAVKCKETA